MITIMRGTEPDELRISREKKLPMAAKLFNQYGPGSAQLKKCLDDGYDCAKRQLFIRQHKKCAYCERRTRYDEQPTEHFRPKKYALRSWKDGDSRRRDDTHYWWLTWTWTNLLFSCNICNGPSHKGNRFPLAQGSSALAAPQRPTSHPLPEQHFDLTAEEPLLLDPGDESIDPLDHLRWRPLDPGRPPRLWSWALRGITTRGRVTQKILKLDAWADVVNDVYLSTVLPRFEAEIAKRTTRGLGRDAILRAWVHLTRELVRPEVELAAARWCMLDTLRTHFSARVESLRLPELPRPRPMSPSGTA